MDQHQEVWKSFKYKSSQGMYAGTLETMTAQTAAVVAAFVMTTGAASMTGVRSVGTSAALGATLIKRRDVEAFVIGVALTMVRSAQSLHVAK